jgi:hypothetical protein
VLTIYQHARFQLLLDQADDPGIANSMLDEFYRPLYSY